MAPDAMDVMDADRASHEQNDGRMDNRLRIRRHDPMAGAVGERVRVLMGVLMRSRLRVRPCRMAGRASGIRHGKGKVVERADAMIVAQIGHVLMRRFLMQASRQHETRSTTCCWVMTSSTTAGLVAVLISRAVGTRVVAGPVRVVVDVIAADAGVGAEAAGVVQVVGGRRIRLDIFQAEVLDATQP